MNRILNAVSAPGAPLKRRGKGIARGGFGLIALISILRAEPSSSPNPGPPPLRRDARVEILAVGNATPIRLEVEVADESPEQDRGLMNRRLSGDGEGMLFVYPTAAPRVFWMRDTPGSLDILFFDSDRRLAALIEHAEPLSDRLLESRVPAQYVLEVPAGFVGRHAVGLGARMDVLPGETGE